MATFDQVSDYTVVTNGNRTITFTDATTGTVLVSQTSLYQINGIYTSIGYQSASGPALLVLQDSNHTSTAQGAIRFAKVAAGAASSVDVYVTSPGASLSGMAATFTGVTLGNSGQLYKVFASGTYEVRETASGSKTPLIDQQITLGGGTSTTILDNGTNAFLMLNDK